MAPDGIFPRIEDTPPPSAGVEDPADDARLVGLALGGDASAFEALYRRHREVVFRAARAVLRNEELAMDATQDAFIRAYRMLHACRDRAAFRPWVRRIGVNRALDMLRERARRPESDLPEEDFLPAEDLAPAPGRAAELSEFSRALRDALDSLSEELRATFLLHAEGFLYREIAEMTGCKFGTVMSRLFHARQRLQAMLAPHLEGER